MHVAVRTTIAALLLGLVACRQAIPGLGPDSGTSGSSTTVSVTAPTLASVEPSNAGPGAKITLKGTRLEGAEIRFGGVLASVVAQPDGSLLATVPDGSKASGVTVKLGNETLSKPFQVISSISIYPSQFDAVPLNRPVALEIRATDTLGNSVAKPRVTLSVDPPEAAQITGPAEVTARQQMPFKIQAFSGTVNVIAVAKGVCNPDNYLLAEVAGTGKPADFNSGIGTLFDVPALGPEERGPVFQARLTRPWGILPVSVPMASGGAPIPGILFSDSGIGRVRFIPDNGSFMVTLIGGGSKVLAASQSASPRDIELLEPAGMAEGRDGNGERLIVIVERGRHRIMGFYPDRFEVFPIAGTGAQSSTRETATDSVLAQPVNLGDKGNKSAGDPLQASFYDPSGVAICFLGSQTTAIFVADTGNHRIRRITRKFSSPQAFEISTILGNGKAGNDVVNAPTLESASASINSPADVACIPELGAKNFLYVSDTNNNQIIQVSNALTTLDATPTVSFVLRTADLDHPSGISVNRRTGDVLIADTLHNRVAMWRPSLLPQVSVFQKIACALTVEVAEGPVLPRAIVSLEPNGFDYPVLITDFGSHRIRKLGLDGDQ